MPGRELLLQSKGRMRLADQTGQGPADFWDAVMRDPPPGGMTAVMTPDLHTPPLYLLGYGVCRECRSVQFSSVQCIKYIM